MMESSDRAGLPRFDEQLDGLLRGRRVLIESINGQRFEGYLDRVRMPDRHVLLRDARELPAGTQYASAIVAHVDWIVPATGDLEIANVELDRVRLCSFATAEFDPDENSNAIQTAARQGFIGCFPVVARQADGVELVEGHKPLWVAEQAGLDAHPMVIESLDGDEVATRFAFAHFPLPHDLDDDCSGHRESDLYSDAALRTAIERYVAEFGDSAMETYPVRFNAERLGLREELGIATA